MSELLANFSKEFPTLCITYSSAQSNLIKLSVSKKSFLSSKQMNMSNTPNSESFFFTKVVEIKRKTIYEPGNIFIIWLPQKCMVILSLVYPQTFTSMFSTRYN